MDNVEENLQLFLTQLDSFSVAVRTCQRKLLDPVDQLTAVLPVERQSILTSIVSDLESSSKSITEELVPGFHDGLDYRLHILRTYLHEY